MIALTISKEKQEQIIKVANAKIKDPWYVLNYDFPIPELGKVAPYGIYVLNENTGFVNLGIDHDTAEFSVESILCWWNMIEKTHFQMRQRSK